VRFSGIPNDEADEGHLGPTRRAPTGPKGADAASICADRFTPAVASRWLIGSLAGEERVQARREHSSGALTLQAGGDAAVAVQDEGDGDGRHLEPLGDGSGRVEQHGIGDARCLREREGTRPGVLGGDGQESDALGLVGVGDVVQGALAGAAGTTPGGGDGDHQQPASGGSRRPAATGEQPALKGDGVGRGVGGGVQPAPERLKGDRSDEEIGEGPAPSMRSDLQPTQASC
jgi:hypothetical protein